MVLKHINHLSSTEAYVYERMWTLKAQSRSNQIFCPTIWQLLASSPGCSFLKR